MNIDWTDLRDIEETPKMGEPVAKAVASGIFHSCYLCDRPLSRLDKAQVDMREYDTQTPGYVYVISYCIWCSRRFLFSE